MSLLAPLALLGGLLAAPIVALYFLKLNRKRVVVPSLLLWQELAQAERLAAPFDKFRRNLLMWVQIALLLLIVLAMARPTIPSAWGGGQASIFVVDISASMAATDGSPTRLDTALREAEAVLSGLPVEAEVAVVVAGGRTEVVMPFTREHGRVRQALRQQRVLEVGGSLREGVQLALSLAQSRPDVDVHVFSDGGGASLSDLPATNTPVRYHRVGRDSGNSGILALDLRASPSSELARQAFVTLQRFGSPVEGTVQLWIDDRLVGVRTTTLGAEAVSLVFELPEGASGVMRAELEAPDDHLELDDVAYAIVDPIRKRRILAVGTDAFTTRALSADRRVHVTVKPSAEVRPIDLEIADALVLAEPVSFDLDGHHVLYLGPKAGGPARLGTPVSRPEVLSWQRTHPVLRLASLDQVQIAELHRVADVGGLTPVVSTTAGPMMLAGERGGGRVVQVVVDPLRSDLPLRVAWPVIVLNAIGWLTEARSGLDHGNVITAGEPWSRRIEVDSQAVSVKGPDGADVSFSVVDRLVRVRDTTRQGVYDVTLGGRRVRFAANLRAPMESDLTPRKALELGVGAAAGSAVQAGLGGGREVWRWLVLAALLVVIVEWALWLRSRTA